jgi:hypothetical protein
VHLQRKLCSAALLENAFLFCRFLYASLQLQTCTPCHAHLQIKLCSIALLENACFSLLYAFLYAFLSVCLLYASLQLQNYTSKQPCQSRVSQCAHGNKPLRSLAKGKQGLLRANTGARESWCVYVELLDVLHPTPFAKDTSARAQPEGHIAFQPTTSVSCARTTNALLLWLWSIFLDQASQEQLSQIQPNSCVSCKGSVTAIMLEWLPCCELDCRYGG